MALPKRRHSKARGRKRRTHWKVEALPLVPCPQCKQLKVPHRVCNVCGYYDGKKILEIKVRRSKKKSA